MPLRPVKPSGSGSRAPLCKPRRCSRRSCREPRSRYEPLGHEYLEEINKKDGITVVCSLHFLSLARRYGTRVIALKGGQVAFDGKPAEIDERRFKEIYGEDAIEVEIGPERSVPQPPSATDAAVVAMGGDTGHGPPPEIR